MRRGWGLAGLVAALPRRGAGPRGRLRWREGKRPGRKSEACSSGRGQDSCTVTELGALSRPVSTESRPDSFVASKAREPWP